MVSCVPEFKEGVIDENFGFFVMGCDGIWETKSDEKICNHLAKEEYPMGKKC
jgi:serine/threonine protein phosphatase PrpC